MSWRRWLLAFVAFLAAGLTASRSEAGCPTCGGGHAGFGHSSWEKSGACLGGDIFTVESQGKGSRLGYGNQRLQHMRYKFNQKHQKHAMYLGDGWLARYQMMGNGAPLVAGAPLVGGPAGASVVDVPVGAPVISDVPVGTPYPAFPSVNPSLPAQTAPAIEDQVRLLP